MRPLAPADAAEFAALVRLAFADLEVQPPPSALRLTGDDVRAHIAAGGGGIFDPGVAGLLWSQAGDGLAISRLAVHPSARRQGLATLLLTLAEAEATSRGLGFLRLSTRLVFVGNRALFRKFGFAEVAEHAHPGYDRPTFVDMAKRVGSEPTGG